MDTFKLSSLQNEKSYKKKLNQPLNRRRKELKMHRGVLK